MHIPLETERTVIGAEGLGPAELLAELDAGARVVAFQYVMSLPGGWPRSRGRSCT